MMHLFFDKYFSRDKPKPEPENVTTLETVNLPGWAHGNGAPCGEPAAMKLAVVNRCLEVISDSIGKMPSYCVESASRERRYPSVLDLLNLRPNEAMTPFVYRKMVELNRLTRGNGYEWVIRDPISLNPVELIPLPAELVDPWQDSRGKIWYDVTHPFTGERMRLRSDDVLHSKAYARDGIRGVSVLTRASEVIGTGRAAQQYQGAYYESGGQPAGVLNAETDLGGYVKGKDGKLSDITRKDALRREWERIHSGPNNAYRIAILDHGLKYTPISSTMAEAQFVESHDVTVLDICNFFGVPAYKVNAGKQSYSSNEQNAIEYVTGTLHPIVTQYEQEQTYKLLTLSQRRTGLELHRNMMVELRGDNASRAAWYKAMWEVGAYSVDDIRGHEDLPDVPGGDVRMASLNYVPLEDFRSLSLKRNGGETSE